MCVSSSSEIELFVFNSKLEKLCFYNKMFYKVSSVCDFGWYRGLNKKAKNTI